MHLITATKRGMCFIKDRVQREQFKFGRLTMMQTDEIFVKNFKSTKFKFLIGMKHGVKEYYVNISSDLSFVMDENEFNDLFDVLEVNDVAVADSEFRGVPYV